MGVLTHGSTARAVRRRNKSQAKHVLANRIDEQRAAESLKFDAWFDEYDLDHDRRLDKAELANLLLHLQPDSPPSDATLDRLIEEAKRHSAEGDPVQREQLRPVLLKNLAYVKEAQFLDTIFSRFDEDHSGTLNRDELQNLMHAVATGDAMAFPDGDPAQKQAACIAYKLKCLNDLHKKGIIDQAALIEKRKRIHDRHHDLMTPRLRDRDPEPEEVAYVLDTADADKDGKIERNECLAALGLWMKILKDDPFHAGGHQVKDKSHACVTM